MEIIILDSPKEAARHGASICCDLIQKKPNAVFGLATGSTPIALYQELIQKNREGVVSFRGITSFNLDEYLGIPASHSQSYRSFMNEKLFSQIDISLENTHVPDGMAKNPLEVGPAYEEKIKNAGGIDLQILGLGTNGHVGFNEPTSSLGSRTRVKTLTKSTVQDNSRFFQAGEFQPRLSVTMGIATIMEAKKILLIATGANKARAVRSMAEGALSAMCPASVLQMHPSVTVLVDEEAASELELHDYYQWVFSEQTHLKESVANL